MFTTVVGLLVIVAAIAVVVWLVGRAIVRTVRQQFRARNVVTRPAPGMRDDDTPSATTDWPSVPPGALLLRTDAVPIAQMGNPAPMLRMRGINGTAYWYRASQSYHEVSDWYDTYLPSDGWQAEPGHDATRVFRRGTLLLWLADGTDPDIWRRLTQPTADLPRNPPSFAPDQPLPTFTLLIYDTRGATPQMPTRGFGRRFGGF